MRDVPRGLPRRHRATGRTRGFSEPTVTVDCRRLLARPDCVPCRTWSGRRPHDPRHQPRIGSACAGVLGRKGDFMPVITRTLETALYVDDLDAAVAFYRDILGLRVLVA